MDTYIDKLRSLLIVDGLHTSRTDGTNHMYYVPHDKTEVIMAEAQAKIDELVNMLLYCNPVPAKKTQYEALMDKHRKGG